MLTGMRLSAQRTAPPAVGLLNHIWGAQSTPRTQRFFHRTPCARLPRHHKFFTSNSVQDPKTAEPKTIENAEKPSRKPPRQPVKKLAGLKNSLRRVAIVAEKGNPARAKVPDLAAESDNRTTVKAICVAKRFDMEKVASILKHHGFLIDPDGTGFDQDDVVHARGLGHGDIFVFASGTVVTWSLPETVVEDLATKTLLPAAEEYSLSNKEVEDLDFEIDAGAEKTLVKADGVVVLGTRLENRELTLNKIAISSGLARSTKLGMLENSLEGYLESTQHIPALLSTGPEETLLSRKLILQKTGELLNLRGQLNHYNELTDALPDMLWDSEARLETYYSAIGKALNVGFRISTLNTRLSYAHDVIKAAQEVVNMAERAKNEQQGTRLEWIIIILIAIEVLFGIYHIHVQLQDVEGAMLSELQRIRAALQERSSALESKIVRRHEISD